MDARIATRVAELLRSMPAEGAARTLALQRLTDACADAESAAAVRAAAAKARESLRQRTIRHEAIPNAISAASALRDLELGSAPSSPDSMREREQLSLALSEPAFVVSVPEWIAELRGIAAERPGTGACTVATAMQLWLWTISHVRKTLGATHTAVVELADAFASLVAVRAQITELVGAADSGDAAARQFYIDLCHVAAARASGQVATLCAEIVFGHRAHPAWDAAGCSSCYQADDLEALEGWMPGIASSARAHSDVIESDGSHAKKAGPCAGTQGVDMFLRLRAKLDGCLTGARFARERAAAALPEMLNGQYLAGKVQ